MTEELHIVKQTTEELHIVKQTSQGYILSDDHCVRFNEKEGHWEYQYANRDFLSLKGTVYDYLIEQAVMNWDWYHTKISFRFKTP